ncbi:hypothetical protein [Mesorhizobium sp. M7A.F.Ca.US.008.03.1.1]|uniref:hypothetical protein n=1 Tax=Mesorhizobium sp. M7A.F.Ca.US.008.03.1.1 TaxID=2496742 RepID=UPI001FDF3238|nr:hypothetical protein [Mesorhizobium sp. M7A.F.Ca.US.008.03.1.1]
MQFDIRGVGDRLPFASLAISIKAIPPGFGRQCFQQPRKRRQAGFLRISFCSNKLAGLA